MYLIKHLRSLPKHMNSPLHMHLIVFQMDCNMIFDIIIIFGRLQTIQLRFAVAFFDILDTKFYYSDPVKYWNAVAIKRRAENLRSSRLILCVACQQMH